MILVFVINCVLVGSKGKEVIKTFKSSVLCGLLFDCEEEDELSAIGLSLLAPADWLSPTEPRSPHAKAKRDNRTHAEA